MITNGVVSIEDGVKAAEDYAPARKVKVEFAFAVPEGHDAIVISNEAAAAANAKVNELLGRVAGVATGATPVKATRTRKPAADNAVTPVVDTSTIGSDKAALEAAAGLKPQDDPNRFAPSVETAEDDIGDILGDAAPVPITDAELAKAAQTKNAQMKVKDPNFSVKIRALVVEYAGQPPKKITDVPVAKRQEFLDKLRDLT